MNQKASSNFPLTEAWERLEAVCRKLWEENSVNAVEVQAVVEEFKAEVHRVDAHRANADEMRSLDLRDYDERVAALRQNYEIELTGLKKRLELQDGMLHEKDMRIEELLKTLARKEEENLNAHAQALRMSASSDEAKAKKMEEFYQEMIKKDAAQADVWQQRHLTLEAESEHRQKIFAERQNELDAWEKRRISEEESLKKRNTDLELRSQELSQEYRKKQQEIEELKASLQKSVTELVRQYQSRLRVNEALPSATPPTARPR